MTRKQRFFVASVIGAVTWAITLFYIFSYNVYTLAPDGSWRLIEPPRMSVMLATMIAMTISFAAWRWYKQDRVDRALSGLNAEEKQELRNRLTQDERLTLNDEGELEVVFSPRKRKLSEEES
jgi:membrane protein DedA with SNARE-associated domain